MISSGVNLGSPTAQPNTHLGVVMKDFVNVFNVCYQLTLDSPTRGGPDSIS